MIMIMYVLITSDERCPVMSCHVRILFGNNCGIYHVQVLRKVSEILGLVYLCVDGTVDDTQHTHTVSLYFIFRISASTNLLQCFLGECVEI